MPKSLRFDCGPITEGSRIISKERPSLILKDNESDPDYAVIVQHNLGLKYAGTVILVPITSTIPSREYPYLVRIAHLKSNIPKFKDGVIKCDQIFTVDKYWIKKYIGTLSVDDLKLVDRALKSSLGIVS